MTVYLTPDSAGGAEIWVDGELAGQVKIVRNGFQIAIGDPQPTRGAVLVIGQEPFSMTFKFRTDNDNGAETPRKDVFTL